MNVAIEQLAQRLAAVLGESSVSLDANMRLSHTVDGLEPLLVCLPDTEQQVAAGLRLCAEAGAVVVPYGGGTAISVGNRSRRIDAAFDLTRLNRVAEHDDANLTATVGAGMTLTRLQEVAARQKQFLPIDPPFPDRATIGGIVVTNLNGPRRSCHGSIRDLVIGMKVALASGEPIKAGGKVVKNVAGYDMCKLFVGSLGTLGIITQVTLRMAPLPETAATLTASGALAQVCHLAREIARSPLLPAATVILNPSACGVMRGGDGHWKLAVLSEGFAETVGRHLGEAQAIAERVGLVTDVRRELLHSQFWAAARDLPLRPGSVAYRVTLPRASLPALLQSLQERETDGFCPAILADTMAGVLWVVAPANEAAAALFHPLVEFARAERGHAVMMAAPPELKQSVDVWGSPPPTLALMRKIKEQFDPHGTLNPGRFLGGI